MATSTDSKATKRAKAPARSPLQIAQDNLTGATTRLEQKKSKQARLAQELATTEAEVASIQREVDYLAMHPLLVEQQQAGQPVVTAQVTDEDAGTESTAPPA